MPTPNKTFNYFTKTTVTTGDFADCKLEWDFVSAALSAINEGSAGNVIEYSFDGVNVHGDLDPAKPTAGMIWDARHHSKIYLRLSTGASAVVRIEAWA
jgi:hypothetical protein